MGKFILYLYPLGTSKPMIIRNLISWELSSSIDTPAVSFQGVFPINKRTPELRKIKFYQEGKLLFSGYLDHGEYQIDQHGGRYSFEARSQGGLLLDNQAEPCTYWNANIATVFAQHLAPYGFHLGISGNEFISGEYTIHQGISQWQGFSNFIIQILGETPYIQDNRVCLEKPNNPPIQVFGVGKNALPFTNLRWWFSPYHLLSKVVLRDGEHRYSSGVRHPLSERYGVERVRYLIPWDEYSQSASHNAKVVLENSSKKLYGLSLTLPCFSHFQFYDIGTISHPCMGEDEEFSLVAQKTGFRQKGYFSELEFFKV